MTKQNDTTRALAQALSGNQPQSGTKRRRAVKHPAFRQLLLDTIAQQPAHTRLPPIRELAERLGTSLVTAHRVVAGLIADGALYSRPRAGVYVAAAPERSSHASAPGAPSVRTSGNASFLSQFKFGTESRLPFQHQLWTDLIAGFDRRYPNIQGEVIFTETPDDPSRALDVYERLGWNVQWSEDESHLLDLRTFSPPEIARRCTGHGLLPLYYRSNYIFFNRDLLQRCDLPVPEFKTWKEQLAYFHAAAPKLKAHGFNPRPFAVQQPVTLLGAAPTQLYSSLVHALESTNDDLATFTAAFASALDLCRLTRRGPGLNNPMRLQERAAFLEGSTAPFYFGHSVDYWEFHQLKLPFELACMPTFCSDDSLFLWPMVGGVSKKSPRPAESMRFLAYLLSPEPQQQFARTGNYATDLTASSAPVMATPSAVLSKALSKSAPVHLPSPELFYLVINVLNNELWHALLDHISVEDAVQQALQLGRSYLRQRSKMAHADQ